MDILEMLTKQAGELYPEDLEVIRAELSAGNYSDIYRAQCNARLDEVKLWLENRNAPEAKDTKDVRKQNGTNMFMDVTDLLPDKNGAKASSQSAEQAAINAIKQIRARPSYKQDFKKYIQNSGVVNADFVEKHYAFFEPWELAAILSLIQMGEAFLEKYFDALDHHGISRYQKFSEAFFMKHYNELNAKTVLENGPNEWRRKENRSRQLDVFLRLKGVRK